MHTTDSGERGARIPYGARQHRWMVALVAVTGALSAAALPWVLFEEGLFAESRNMIMALTGIVMVPYSGWFLLDVARGRIARGQLVITPSGVHHRSTLHAEFVPWDSVWSVNARRERGPTIELDVRPGATQRRSTSGLARLEPAQNSGMVRVRARALAVDPAVAYHTLGYYWSRPEARAELATNDGLRRIRSGHLAAGG